MILLYHRSQRNTVESSLVLHADTMEEESRQFGANFDFGFDAINRAAVALLVYDNRHCFSDCI